MLAYLIKDSCKLNIIKDGTHFGLHIMLEIVRIVEIERPEKATAGNRFANELGKCENTARPLRI